MRRGTVTVIAIGLAVLAGVLPLAATAYLSRQSAVEAERDHLEAFAQSTLRRSDRTLDPMRTLLKQLQSERWAPCSVAHIARMRQLALDAPSVKEIGFYQGGQLVCTSWGRLATPKPQGTPDYRMRDGFGLYIDVQPIAGVRHDILVLAHGDYNALVREARLVDVLTDSSMALGVATKAGQLITTSAPVDPALVRKLTTGTTSGSDGRHIYASVAGEDLIGFAVADMAIATARSDREFLAMLPIGLVASLALVGTVLWVSRQQLSLTGELRRAIRDGRLTVHYQPMIELSTGLCAGAEALIRWQDSDGRWISPDLFVPHAEAHGLIDELTDVMIDRVVDDLAGILSAETRLHVSINISSADMESGRFLPHLASALARTGVSPSQIWLEATERGFINAEAARHVIEAARAAGHRISIDDFGTGYSSLSMLETLPLDTLKIDRSFIAAIGKGAAKSVVTPAIIEMAHGLKLDLVAEGIETLEQEAYVRASGVEFAQGWLYAPAMPAAEFVDYYHQRNQGRVARTLRSVA